MSNRHYIELERVADLLTTVHPMGAVKACGMLEAAAWLKDVIDEVRSHRQSDSPHDDDSKERDLELHVAKMCEHMEWLNTLEPSEKSKRQLGHYVAGLNKAIAIAEQSDAPWLFLGQLERIFHHARIAFGQDWMERARAERSEFFRDNCDDDDGNDDGRWDDHPYV